MKITTQESEKKIQEARELWNAIDNVYVETLQATIDNFGITECWHDELGFTQVVFAEGSDHIDNSILDEYFDEKYSQMANLALAYAKAQASGYDKWTEKIKKEKAQRANDMQYKEETEARERAEAQGELEARHEKEMEMEAQWGRIETEAYEEEISKQIEEYRNYKQEYPARSFNTWQARKNGEPDLEKEAEEECDHELQIQENQEYHNNRANDQERVCMLRQSIKTLEVMIDATRQELRELESDD